MLARVSLSGEFECLAKGARVARVRPATAVWDQAHMARETMPRASRELRGLMPWSKAKAFQGKGCVALR